MRAMAPIVGKRREDCLVNRSTWLRIMLVVLFGIWSSGGIASIAAESRGSSQFFPIGLICVDALPYSNKVTEEFPDIAAAGFNLIHSYQFESTLDDPANTNENARAYLDAAAKHGLKVLMGVPGDCVSNGDLACIQKRVSVLKSHPALFGWQLYDEPENPGDPTNPLKLEYLISAYRAIKKLDALHPVSISAADPVDTDYRYRKGADIVMTQLLVIPTDFWYGETPLGEVVRDIIGPAVTLLTQEGKSTLPQVQAYNLGTDPLMKLPPSMGRYPTRDEMRFQAYYSIILGGKGLFFNCYRYNYDGGDSPLDDISRTANPAQWQAVSSVASELKSISPVLLAPTQDSQSAGISIAGGSIVEMMVKKYRGKTYLLTVNPSGDSVVIRFALVQDQFPNPTVKLLPEKKYIPLQDGLLVDMWRPYDVRIYEIARDGEAVRP